MAYIKYKRLNSLTLGGKYHVIKIGTDSSGRPIYMSERMWGAWLAVMDRLGDNLANELDIVQGAFMVFAGGGATQSAGYHDLSSCIDTRVWDIDSSEERKVIHASRNEAWAVWRRDLSHGGFDEHMHWTLLDEFKGVAGGGAQPSAAGAISQWGSYRRGMDGLSPEHRDYHWRPSPLPKPFNLQQWRKEENDVDLQDLMDHQLRDDPKLTVADALRNGSAARGDIDELAKRFALYVTAEKKRWGNLKARDEALAETLKTIAENVDDTATKSQLVNIATSLEAKLDSIDSQVSS